MHSTDQTTAQKLLGERYEIQSELGSGASSIVYAAYDRKLNRQVAIKILRYTISGAGSDEKVQRFFREGAALSRLQHKNIAEVYRLDALKDRRPYLVMELVAGEPLTAVIEREGAFTVSAAAALCAQLAEAVASAHECGILHRDIKPSNIIVNRTEAGQTAKIIDFGLSSMRPGAAADQAKLTRTGALIGTAAYMSPEQCRGDKVDARTDVYSLGCVLFELVTGSPPFTATDPLQLIYAHLNREVPKLSQLDRDAKLPGLLDDIIKTALAKDPDERYADMSAMLDDLKRLATAQSGARFSSARLPHLDDGLPRPISPRMRSAPLVLFLFLCLLPCVVAAMLVVSPTLAAEAVATVGDQISPETASHLNHWLTQSKLTIMGSSAAAQFGNATLNLEAVQHWHANDRFLLMSDYVRALKPGCNFGDGFNLSLVILSDFCDAIRQHTALDFDNARLAAQFLIDNQDKISGDNAQMLEKCLVRSNDEQIHELTRSDRYPQQRSAIGLYVQLNVLTAICAARAPSLTEYDASLALKGLNGAVNYSFDLTDDEFEKMVQLKKPLAARTAGYTHHEAEIDRAVVRRDLHLNRIDKAISEFDRLDASPHAGWTPAELQDHYDLSDTISKLRH
jgi:serine/threonine protein kinase